MDKRSTFSSSSGVGLWELPPPRHRIVPTDQARRTSRFRVVRPSIGIKLGQGIWPFSRGEWLEGVLLKHPVNASRKVIIATETGTFNLNEEDLEEVSGMKTLRS